MFTQEHTTVIDVKTLVYQHPIILVVYSKETN